MTKPASWFLARAANASEHLHSNDRHATPAELASLAAADALISIALMMQNDRCGLEDAEKPK